MKQTEIIENINSRIIAKLQEGVNPWKKPWHSFVTGTLDPDMFAINYVSGEAYTGINQIVLEPGYYVTYKQAKDLNGKPQKGKGQLVVFSSLVLKEVTEPQELVDTLNAMYEEALKNGEAEEDKPFVVCNERREYTRNTNGTWETTFWCLKEYYVWNINDCEGIRKDKHFKPQKGGVEFNLSAEEVIADYVKRANLTLVREYGNRAYYRPATHEVHVPHKSQFDDVGELYSTTFHELGHSTGHHTLLNRSTLNNINAWGDGVYSKEELVAEITAAYSIATLGIDTDNTLANSCAYLKSWAQHIEGDKDLQRNIISATTEATKAFKLIFNLA